MSVQRLPSLLACDHSFYVYVSTSTMKHHWCSWSSCRSTRTYADCLSGFFHAQQLQRLWSAFFLKVDC